MKNLASIKVESYSAKEWQMAVLMFGAYVSVGVFVSQYVPEGIVLAPAIGIALAGAYFGWPRLWPAVLLAAVTAEMLAGSSFETTILTTIAVTAMSVAGAFLLRSAKIDPLFRRYRDTFSLIMTILVISLISPTINSLWATVTGALYSPMHWGQNYASTVFSLLVVTPFVLRWCGKVRFSRGPRETIETVLIFALLIAIDSAIYMNGVTVVLGIRLIYFLFIPLFWIALRLRPRFVTLALLITSAFAISSVLGTPTPALLAPLLFQAETLLITISIIFLVIVALEEDRRLNTNLMRSQLATLENAIARISSESRAKNDFIAILAHELRNPLAPIVSAIDVMKLKANRDKDDMEMLEIMDDRMKTVRRLLDDLLDVSRISEGKISINKAPVDLEHVLRKALISTEHHVRERHQTVVAKGIEKGYIVQGDAIRLEQVFTNLLTNASKYSNSGDQIVLSMSRKEGCAVIAIADQGIGIPADSIEHIFTPFHQVGSGARTQKGLGIGLALVKSFVHVHGGTVTAQSNGKGKGSTFTVMLPLSASTS